MRAVSFNDYSHPGYQKLAGDEKAQTDQPQPTISSKKASSRKLNRVDSMQGTSSFLASYVNLFKSIVGAGVLTLPAGVAAFSDRPATLYPCLILAAMMGIVNAYSFWMLGRLSLQLKRGTYANLMAAVFGTGHQMKLEWLIVVHCGTGVLMFEIIIADLARDLAGMWDIEGLLAERSVLLIALAALVLAPLSLLRSFSALAPFAAAGTAGVLYTAAFMGVRLGQGAYAEGGHFYDKLTVKPEFNEKSGFSQSDYFQSFVLVSMLATAFVAHFNAPRFAQQLIKPTACRLGVLCTLAFGTSFVLMGGVMCMGFLTFGGASQGLILNSYAVTDSLAAFARAANLVSVLAGYPFMLVAFRDGLLQLLLKPAIAEANWKPSVSVRQSTSLTLVAVITAVACVVTDLGVVVALVGALLASTIVYILPALALRGVVKTWMEDGSASAAERIEYHANKGLLIFGIVLAIIGAFATCYSEAVKIGLVKPQ